MHIGAHLRQDHIEQIGRMRLQLIRRILRNAAKKSSCDAVIATLCPNHQNVWDLRNTYIFTSTNL